MGAVSSLYKGHRYPAQIISHCVWLYHRFPLSFREVEEMMITSSSRVPAAGWAGGSSRHDYLGGGLMVAASSASMVQPCAMSWLRTMVMSSAVQ